MTSAKPLPKDHIGLEDLEALITLTPDWPKTGVVFRDISPLLATRFNAMVDYLCGLIPMDERDNIDAFAGVDARGFIMAAAMAQAMGKNFVIVRKGGKLPPPSAVETYDLEYGTATIEMKPGQGRIILVDDVLATGGTLRAAADLCAASGYDVTGFITLIDLKFLNDFSWNGLRVKSLFQYK
jgi:adenine phosphoribosyltransferase